MQQVPKEKLDLPDLKEKPDLLVEMVLLVIQDPTEKLEKQVPKERQVQPVLEVLTEEQLIPAQLDILVIPDIQGIPVLKDLTVLHRIQVLLEPLDPLDLKERLVIQVQREPMELHLIPVLLEILDPQVTPDRLDT